MGEWASVDDGVSVWAPCSVDFKTTQMSLIPVSSMRSNGLSPIFPQVQMDSRV